MALFLHLALALTMLATTSAFAEPDRPITLFAYEDPPFITNGPEGVGGRTVAVARAVFSKAQVPVDIQIQPLHRALRNAKDQPQRCALSFKKTPDRVDAFQWVGPVHHGGWGIFTRPGVTPLPTQEQSKAEPVLVQAGAALIEELKGAGYNPLVVERTQRGIRALYMQRVNFIAGGLTTLPTKAMAMGYEPPALVSVFKMIDFYMVCSRSTDEKIVRRLQSSLDQLVSEKALDLN